MAAGLRSFLFQWFGGAATKGYSLGVATDARTLWADGIEEVRADELVSEIHAERIDPISYD